MKKFLIATGVAVLAFATVAGAQGYMFNTNLTVGSTGADVVALQTAVMSAGFDIPAITSGVAAKGYFGSQTKTAVMAYQSSKAIPNTGFVGPLTRAALNGTPSSTGGSTTVMCPVGYVCTQVGGGTSTGGSTTLEGTDGLISDVNELSQYNNEEVGDGESDVKVLGLEVEASNEGDIALKSVKVKITITNASGSDNLDDYVDAVSVWMGSTEVGSSDVSGFNESTNGVFSKTITLKSGTIIKADDVEKLYVAVDAVNNLDSGDIDSESVTVEVESIRFEDGSGVTTTDTSTGDLGSLSTTVDFVGFSSAANTELKLSTDNSSPDATIVMVDDESDTDDVKLTVGKFRLDGSSDVVIDEIPVTLTGVASSSLAAIVNSITLKLDNGDEYTESVSTTTNHTDTIVFDNLDIDLAAGESLVFTILADINDINPTALKATDFAEGYYLKADVTSTNRAAIDVENEEGDDLTASERSGTVVGEYQEFRTEGIGLTLVSTDTSATTGTSANDDVGLFTIKFKVTAFGESAYVSSSTVGYTYALDKGGVSTSTALTSASIVNNTDTDITAVFGNYMIEDGETEQFTLTVSLPMSAGTHTSGQYRVSLTGVKWSTTDETVVNDNTYASELDAFKTDYEVLN